MYSLGVILFTLFFGTQPWRSHAGNLRKDEPDIESEMAEKEEMAKYSQMTSGDPL
jgi:hypothetical protein